MRISQGENSRDPQDEKSRKFRILQTFKDFDGLRWASMSSDGLSWASMNSDGLSWASMGFHGLRWAPMSFDGLRCLETLGQILGIWVVLEVYNRFVGFLLSSGVIRLP